MIHNDIELIIGKPWIDAMISVVIPALNAARSIARAIQSAAAERPHEIIVVDDGSTDQTATVAYNQGARVISTTNGGPGRARNIGISAASSDWIALLDADDFWYPGKLQAQSIEMAPNVGMVGTCSDYSLHHFRSEIGLSDLWERNPIVTSSVLLSRLAWAQAGGFSERRDIVGVEDYHLWLRIATLGWRVRCIPQPLTHYSVGELSSNVERQAAALISMLGDLQDCLPYDAEALRSRQLAVLDSAARQAISLRELRAARVMALRALRNQPTPARALRLGVACFPLRLLDIAARVSHATRTVRAEQESAMAKSPTASAICQQAPVAGGRFQLYQRWSLDKYSHR